MSDRDWEALISSLIFLVGLGGLPVLVKAAANILIKIEQRKEQQPK